MLYLPNELINTVFTILKRDDSRPNVDLLCCAVVCRFWYRCACPLIEESQMLALYPQNYHGDDLDRIVKVFCDSKRYGLGLGELVHEVKFDKLEFLKFINKYTDSARASSILHLLRVLQPYAYMLNFNLGSVTTRTRINATREVLMQLPPILPAVTSLRICHLSTVFPIPRRNTRDAHTSLHPIGSFINELSPRLEQFHLYNSDLTSDLAIALRSCPHIHTINFIQTDFRLSPNELITTISSWRNLRRLVIRQPEQSSWSTKIISLLARNPPPLLFLELSNLGHSCKPDVLISLITLTAQTLTCLYLPTCTNPESFLSQLVSISLPSLRILGLAHVHESLSGINAVHELGRVAGSRARVPWPALRELTMAQCTCVCPRFIEILIESCLRLETVCFTLPTWLETEMEIEIQIEPEMGGVRGVLFDRGFVRKIDCRCILEGDEKENKKYCVVWEKIVESA